MNSPWSINPRRLLLIMRNDLLSQARAIALTAGSAFVLMFVTWIIAVFTRQSGNFYPFFFGAIVLVGGPVLTSLSFSQMHHPLKGLAYLTLPGSQTEKYLSKLFLTSIGFVTATVLFFYAFSFVASMTGRLVFGLSMPLFTITRQGSFQIALAFLLHIHPLVFFGSIYFQRLALLKTVLCVLSFAIALGVLMTVVGWNLFSGIDGAVALHNLVRNVSAWIGTHGSTVKTGAVILFRVIIPIFFIGLGFLRFTEYEAGNGV